MHRIWVAASLLAIAIAIAAIGASGASAFPGTISPQVPGVGNATGIDGPGPEVEVFGGRSGIGERGVTWVEVRCTTSTGRGCSGTLTLLTGGGLRVGSTAFELAERQSEGVHIRLVRKARTRASRRSGLKLAAQACATDSLGRSACDSAGLTLRSRR